jgi:hypothetical protein
VKFSDDLSMMKATGRNLATVEIVSGTFDSSAPVCIDWLKRVQNWRTLVLDHELGFNFDHFRRLYSNYIMDSEPVDCNPEIPEWMGKITKPRIARLEARINQICMNRMLSMMKRGELTLDCLLPPGAITGDKVVIPHGCRVPLHLEAK